MQHTNNTIQRRNCKAPLLVMWAGAREDEWVDGVGAKLAKAAATFKPVRDS